MNRVFYAHTSEGGTQNWELLRDHLSETARRAEGFAASFGCEDLGYAAGLLHDLGKYQQSFQDRLNGSNERVDHAAHGAVFARGSLGPFGSLIAHGIAGHHTGLADGLFAAEGRLVQQQQSLPDVEKAAARDGLNLPKTLRSGLMKPSSHIGFQLAFRTRMLFSCLVDADYLATENFYARAEGRPPPPRGSEASLSDLGLALDRRLNAFPTPHPGSLNEKRAEILNHARALANSAPGVFTLTVPTGGGKTLTSLAFAMDHARKHDLERVIVAIPFTSVIEQTAQVYREALAPHEGSILEHHSAFDQSHVDGKEARSKLSLAMETWDQPLVVTTTVRLFESLFSNRPSQCRKLHNLARSVIILDEVQTLPLGLLRPCVEALSELALNYGCSIVLCTATQPALLDSPSASGRAFAGGFKNTQELAPDPLGLFNALRRVSASAPLRQFGAFA
jgi:CRISPR-associated endonuclease/helicase Cas3